MVTLVKQYMARKKKIPLCFLNRKTTLEIEVGTKVTCLCYFYISLVSNRDLHLVFAKNINKLRHVTEGLAHVPDIRVVL